MNNLLTVAYTIVKFAFLPKGNNVCDIRIACMKGEDFYRTYFTTAVFLEKQKSLQKVAT